MGMSFYVIAERERDAEFERMFKVLQACKDNDVSVPQEVRTYFGRHVDDYDDAEAVADAALDVDISKIVREVQGDYYEDHVIDLKDLPKSVVRLKFRASA